MGETLQPQEGIRHDHADRLIRLFRHQVVIDLPAIVRALPDRSRYGIYRDLKAVGHLRSYNHAGRFFTLNDIPRFDPDGLWRYQGVFFSRHGTLKATVEHLVQTSYAGWTHDELRERLHVRVHNTLLDLVRRNGIAREVVGRLFLYLHVDPGIRAKQVARRREQVGQTVAGPLEIIGWAKPAASPVLIVEGD